MTDCPPSLRGDLSKWLCEINTGVYVGKVSGRVRDALWDRVCQNLKGGRATMVFSTNNEQGMDFRVHNSSWVPVDFEGIKLMRRPLSGIGGANIDLRPGFSKAAKRKFAQKKKTSFPRSENNYVVIDLETTGLQPSTDEILEIGAIKVENNVQVKEFSCLVTGEKKVPHSITELTHITDELRKEQGITLDAALTEFITFIGKDLLIGYNISFDLEFLRMASKKCSKPLLTNRCKELQNMARRKVHSLSDWKLTSLAKHFGIDVQSAHRAINDCHLIQAVYCKLKEM